MLWLITCLIIIFCIYTLAPETQKQRPKIPVCEVRQLPSQKSPKDDTMEDFMQSLGGNTGYLDTLMGWIFSTCYSWNQPQSWDSLHVQICKVAKIYPHKPDTRNGTKLSWEIEVSQPQFFYFLILEGAGNDICAVFKYCDYLLSWY